jgi:hypothetical protein
MNIEHFAAHGAEKNSRKCSTGITIARDCPSEVIVLWKDDHIAILCCCFFGLVGKRYYRIYTSSLFCCNDPLQKLKKKMS